MIPVPLLLAVVSAASIASLAARAGEPPVTASALAGLDDAAKERFLLEGRIVRSRDAGGGVTSSRRATLRLDGVEHDAHVQTIDVAKPMANLDDGPPELDFRDSYKNNVAAYRLDRLLGLGMVPVTVVRRHGKDNAAFTWWVDDVRMSERERRRRKIEPPDATRWNRQVAVVRAFDELIYNTDRHLGNLLIDGDWRIWMIDHTRAFKVFKTIGRPQRLGTRCARQLLAALRRLDGDALRERMRDVLVPGQVEALLARRDQIVAHYDARVRALGEAAVLYDLPPRGGDRAPDDPQAARDRP
ncbi:MAG TPA: hypothetical protein VGB87_25300 [Vicinamibacteria bacterium]